MARIFVSYAREDQAAAKRIVDALAVEGLDAWWDHEIPPGRSWDEVIGTRIAEAQAVIVLWSARSVGSNFVKEEAQLAYDAGKLLPVKVGEVEPPVGFRRVHAANLADWRGEANHAQWRALLGEVRQRLNVAQAAAPSPVDHVPSASPSTPQDASRPPVWYWLASVAGLLWYGVVVFDLVVNRGAYFLMFPGWLVVVWCIGRAAGLAGAIALLVRRRWATPLFAVAGFVWLADQVITPGFQTPSAFTLAGLLPSAFAVAGLFLLARTARKRGWTR